MSPPKTDNPREKKVTARFTPEEVEMLAERARQRGESISGLLREIVVAAIDEIQARIEEEGTRG